MCQKNNQIILKVFPFSVLHQHPLVCSIYGRRDASFYAHSSLHAQKCPLKQTKKKFQKKNQIILKVFSFIVRRQRRLVCGVYRRRDAFIACVAASVPPPPSPPPPPLTPLTHGARQVGSTQKDHPRDQFTVGLHPATGRF